MRRLIVPILKKYIKLLISIMLISAMGCGIMTGLSAAYASLEDTFSAYLDEYGYPDAIITTEAADSTIVNEIKTIGAVSQVNARLCGDTFLRNKDGRYLSARLFSYSPEDIQRFKFWDKKDSGKKDDIYIEYNFAEDNNISVGDIVRIRFLDEYRELFVSGIVTSPETLSMQPSDDAFGVITDFGYAYVSSALLKKEFYSRYNASKAELDDRQSELDTEWKNGKSRLEEAEKTLEDAKQQLRDNKALLSDSTYKADQLLMQLDISEDKLKADQNELSSGRKALIDKKNSIFDALKKLTDQEAWLIEASEGLKKADEAMQTLEKLSAYADNPQTALLMDILEAHPDTALSDISEKAELLKSVAELFRSYGFSYEMTDSVTDFSNKLTAFLDQAVTDQIFISSAQLREPELISDQDKDKLISMMKRYKIYDDEQSIEEGFERLSAAVSEIITTAQKNRIYELASFLPVIGSSETLYQLINAVSDMKDIAAVLSRYSGKPVETAGDLASVYKTAVPRALEEKERLTLQREEIIAALAGSGLTEKDVADVPALIVNRTRQAQESASQIDNSISQIDKGLVKISEGLAQIEESRREISSELEKNKKALSDKEKELDKKEKEYINERTKALGEFENLKDELEKAYKKLEMSENYAEVCNQLLVYFKDGADKNAELEKLRDIISDEDVEIKSSVISEESAVVKRINENLDTIDTMLKLMPGVFFAIILIVVSMFMTLIIKQSRREIGILRALGFTKGNILMLYSKVNLIVSLFAVALGTGIGFCLMKLVGDYYIDLFPLPYVRLRLDLVMYILSAVCTLIAGQVSTLISAGAITKILPSEAMSRSAPETANIPRLLRWMTSRTGPMTKFSVTTLVRNNKRFVYSVICISASVMMVFSSFAFISSKNHLLHQVYDERIHYDCQIFFKEDPSQEIMDKLEELHILRNVQTLPFYQSEISFGEKSEKAVINSPQTDTGLISVYGEGSEKLEIPDSGIILEKHLAESIGASKGDTVIIKGVDVRVEDISDQSASRFQYMSPGAMKKLGKPTAGSVICCINQEDEEELLEFLTGQEDYLYTVFTRLSREGLEKVFRTYDLAAWILIGFAVAIGLIIVINTTNTNLLEKKRELCILRTLGFQQGEISRKWFVQSFLQFIISCAIGLPAGVFIAKAVLQRLSMDRMEYVFANNPTEYILTVLIVFVYIIVSHFIAMRSMKKWDLVENVKERE